MPIKSVMPSSHLILCHPLLLLPPVPPSIRVFSNESTLRMRWPKYWSFSFSISPSNEHPGLISFRMDWTSHLQNSICHQLLPETLQFQSSPSFCNNVIISNPNLSLLKKQPSCQLGFWLVTKKICLTLWYFAFTRLPHIVVEQNTTQVLLESASLWL